MYKHKGNRIFSFCSFFSVRLPYWKSSSCVTLSFVLASICSHNSCSWQLSTHHTCPPLCSYSSIKHSTFFFFFSKHAVQIHQLLEFVQIHQLLEFALLFYFSCTICPICSFFHSVLVQCNRVWSALFLSPLAVRLPECLKPMWDRVLLKVSTSSKSATAHSFCFLHFG